MPRIGLLSGESAVRLQPEASHQDVRKLFQAKKVAVLRPRMLHVDSRLHNGNVRKRKKLDFTFPPQLLAVADEVIEWSGANSRRLALGAGNASA
jgi:hypothetical protein